MKMRLQFWNCKLENRGFAFSLDVMVGITLVMALLVLSTFYITKAGDESVSRLQMTRVGYDILSVLGKEGKLNRLSLEEIDSGVNRMLPINYDIRVKVECNSGEVILVETDDVFPSDKFVSSGKVVFVTDTEKYCMAGFNIWLK